MTPKNNTWICDKCGGVIAKPQDGWVQWLRVKDPMTEERHSEGLQLVHRSGATPKDIGGKCIYDGNAVFRTHNATQADMALPDFLGPNGLMRLLSFIDESDGFKSNEEVVEMIKRLFIPGYEYARLVMDEAINDGAFEPNTRDGFPHQFQIDAVLDWIKENRKDD